MTQQVQAPQTVGFYGQLYNELVRPNQIWRSSRYFVRRWGPVLEPSRFWAVVAARHLSYLSEEQNGNFKAWDNEIAGEANLSNSHYRRLKPEMAEASSPLSLFLKKGSLSYITSRNSGGDGRVRKGRTRYTVRLDDPLTPADARQVELELRAEGINRSTKPEEIGQILARCRMLEQTRFYAAEDELNSTTYGSWQAIYVSDIVQAITQKNLADHPAVAEQAEALHTYLTGGDFIGRRYFRNSWLPVVGAGPAWLLTWLRSYCFLDESTGEIRNELAFSKIELAQKLGIHKNALNRWLKALEQIPEQPFNFIKEIDRVKQPDNSVLVRFEVGMFEPLTACDLELLSDKFEVESGQLSAGSDSRQNPPLDSRQSQTLGSIQNERYKMNGPHQPTHTDERNKSAVVPPISGGAVQNEHYEQPTASRPTHLNERDVAPAIQIERNNGSDLSGAPHTIELNETGSDMLNPQMNGSHPLNDQTIAPKRVDINKYLKNLTQLMNGDKELNEDDYALLETAVADFSSDLGIAQAMFGTSAEFLRMIGADAGASWTVQVLDMGIPVTTLAAWWLYALAEPGIKRPVPFVLKRASGGHVAPESFVRLAKMGLDQWLSLAFGLELGLTLEMPGRDEWLGVYGDYSLEAIPLVGGLVAGVLERISCRQEKAEQRPETVGRQQAGDTSESNKVGDAIWGKVVEQLVGRVSEMELEIFLRPCVLRFGGSEGGWVLVAQDGSAEAYLKMMLQQKITTALHEVGVSGGLSVISYQSSVKGSPLEDVLDSSLGNRESNTENSEQKTDALWETVLSELQLALPGPAYSTWLKDSALMGDAQGGYLIEVRNDQAKDWVQTRFFHLIVQTMTGLLGNRKFDLSVVSRT